MKWLKWLFKNDKVAFQVGFWIFSVECTLWLFPFLWRLQFFKTGGFLVVAFGPLFFELDWWK